MKTFIKSKSGANAAGPGFRTSNHFKASVFTPGKINPKASAPKFNPSQFRTQHKGG